MLKQEGEEKTVAYLGPRGTYSEEVAYQIHTGNQVLFTAYSSIDAAIMSVVNGVSDECVVPVENSLEGSVTITLDTLALVENLFIIRESTHAIRHNLLVNPQNGPVEVIVSHSQALAQCRSYLQEHYPSAQVKAVQSTAEAACCVASGMPNHAAIGSLRATKLYELDVAAAGIQDNSYNSTRFLVLGRKPAVLQKEPHKTSIVCQIDGKKPGSLCEILQEFARRNVNLTRIESRPARTQMGAYIFFLDLDGSLADYEVFAAVKAVQEKSIWFKSFGSYPVVDTSQPNGELF